VLGKKTGALQAPDSILLTPIKKTSTPGLKAAAIITPAIKKVSIVF
jgi:hypothetical protein